VLYCEPQNAKVYFKSNVLLQIFFTVNEVVFQVVSQFEVYLKWMSLIESIFF
jgi:hypothetical protein